MYSGFPWCSLRWIAVASLGDRHKQIGWRQGVNLLITGISRNSSSIVFGINPKRHWQEKENERANASMHTMAMRKCTETGVWSRSHTNTHTQTKEARGRQSTKYLAGTLPQLWWTHCDHNRGRSPTHTLTQTMDPQHCYNSESVFRVWHKHKTKQKKAEKVNNN